MQAVRGAERSSDSLFLLTKSVFLLMLQENGVKNKRAAYSPHSDLEVRCHGEQADPV